VRSPRSDELTSEVRQAAAAFGVEAVTDALEHTAHEALAVSRDRKEVAACSLNHMASETFTPLTSLTCCSVPRAHATSIAAPRSALLPCVMSDTLRAHGAPHLREARQVIERNGEPTSGQNDGSWVGVMFLGLVILLAVLFALYVLLWNGGGNR
jgi:hypothetical protein